MADVLSMREKVRRIDSFIQRLAAVRTMLQEAKAERDNLMREGEPPTDIETAMGTRLSAIETIADQIGTDLGNVNYQYENLVQVGKHAGYTSAAIDHDGPTITANGGSPFSVFDVADVLLIENAEDAGNNGEYTVSSVSGTVLTLSANLAVTNAADTSIKISLKER